MTRKHYVAIAAAIAIESGRKSAHGCAETPFVLQILANDLANIFAADNPRFDRERFLAACKVV